MAEQQQRKSPPTRYKTTRPTLPLTPNRKVIETCVDDTITIQLRRFEPTDLEHVHRLRTQEAVMVNTSAGTCDADPGVTQTWMNRFLPPKDANTFDLMLWAKQGDEPWEHIGVMGCHVFEPVPHIGYMLRTEWWGKSIATKALQAFLGAWWALERREVEVDLHSVEDEHELHLMRLEWDDNKNHINPSVGLQAVPEILLAEIEERNIGSIKVVERCGFKYRARETVVEEQGSFALLDYTATNPTAQ